MPGLSFSPFNQSGTKPTQSGQQSPVQDAIKILSFRMPSVVGAAPAPGALLGGPTAQGGGIGGGLAQEFIRRLMQGQGLQTPPGTPGTSPTSYGQAQTNPFQTAPQGFQAPATSGLPASVEFGKNPGGGTPPVWGGPTVSPGAGTFQPGPGANPTWNPPTAPNPAATWQGSYTPQMPGAMGTQPY